MCWKWSIGYMRLLPFGENLNANIFLRLRKMSKSLSHPAFSTAVQIAGDGKFLTCHYAHSHF